MCAHGLKFSEKREQSVVIELLEYFSQEISFLSSNFCAILVFAFLYCSVLL